MSKLKIELCPETGICSIIKSDASKIDLMPNEVGDVRKASGSAESIKQVLSEIDSDFAKALDADELAQVSGRLK